ncbi:hypothetical protein AB1K70_19630 [Bremerella sp. JC770]|uniref:hypothetical protein n=1 Tax=Bremerella sp. JC770 TaxID=3232137 RepID=UPI003457DCD3
MKILINGKDVDRKKVTYLELGFGQEMSEEEYTCIVQLSDPEFRAAILEEFNEFVSDCEEDDKVTEGSAAVPEIVHNDFPSFEELLASDKDALCRVVRKYLFFELLEGMLGRSPSPDFTFAVSSLDDITASDGVFFISCKAFSIS